MYISANIARKMYFIVNDAVFCGSNCILMLKECLSNSMFHTDMKNTAGTTERHKSKPRSFLQCFAVNCRRNELLCCCNNSGINVICATDRIRMSVPPFLRAGGAAFFLRRPIPDR